MNKLRTFRQTHKISQAELAKVLNTTQQQISLYETGRRKLDEDQITEICKIYKVNPVELLQNEEGSVIVKSIKETIMEIANYIKEQKRKVELIEIIEKFINEKYARLNENDLEIVRMLIKEHNEEYK